MAFLRLIKMIIAPLVFSTLVVGIAHMGDAASVGRVGVKALGWFVCASLVSLTLGLIMVQPAAARRRTCRLPLPDSGQSTGLADRPFTLKDFVTHLVPTSIVEAMASNEILQIVVFSVFFGVGAGRARRKRAERAGRWSSELAHDHAEGDRLCDEARAARGVRGDGRHRRRPTASGSCATYAKFIGGFYLVAGACCGRC